LKLTPATAGVSDEVHLPWFSCGKPEISPEAADIAPAQQKNE